MEPKSKTILAIGVRGSLAWRAWVGQLAKSRRMSINTYIDKLLTEDAEKIGFEPPPPRLGNGE